LILLMLCITSREFSLRQKTEEPGWLQAVTKLSDSELKLMRRCPCESEGIFHGLY
jgi:hypothetical protein